MIRIVVTKKDSTVMTQSFKSSQDAKSWLDAMKSQNVFGRNGRWIHSHDVESHGEDLKMATNVRMTGGPDSESYEFYFPADYTIEEIVQTVSPQVGYKFGVNSMKHFNTLHPLLQKVLLKVLETYDIAIIQGHRGEADQNDAFARGVSDLKWPLSKHNKFPSEAADLLPAKFKDWKNREQFIYMAGYITATAATMGIKIRCGIDFNQDLSFSNDRLFDGPHVELVLDDNTSNG